MKRAMRWALAGGLAAAGFGLWLLLRPGPIDVDLGRVGPQRLTVVIEEDGETRVRLRHVISAPVAGRFEPGRIDEGDRVRQAQPLGLIYPAPLDARQRASAEARLAAAEAARRAADARGEQARIASADAQRTLERLVQLAARAPVAAEELDRTRAASQAADREHDAARFDAQAAAADVAAARAALEGTSDSVRAHPVVLRAPARGTVLRVVEECGRVVAAGSPLVEVGDLAGLEVAVDVLSEDAVQIRPGALVWLSVAAGDSAPGRVRRIEPSGFRRVSPLGVEEQRVHVVVDFTAPPAGIGDRYRVEARIVVWDSAGVLSVPAGALFRDGERWAVYLARDGQARRAVVELGRRAAEVVQVVSGLREGDTVVLQPGDLVTDGARIRPRTR